MTVAVVDVKTTGLSPTTDRVVEVGVVLLDGRGEVEGEFETLLNPGWDIGPSYMHGLGAADVAEAPRFAEVARYLRSLLAGRLVVAHNGLLCLRYLAREFARAGLPVDLSPALCTMRLASLFFGPGTRSLQALCDFADIPRGPGRGALHDARATAQLMLHMLTSHLGEASLAGAGFRVHFAHDGTYQGFEALDAWFYELVDAASWTTVDPCPPCRIQPRVAATTARQGDDYLGGLVAALPALGDASPGMAPYLAVLDRILEAGLAGVVEAEQLLGLAAELGCDRAEVTAAHKRYFEALAMVAYADGVVTAEERAELHHVAVLLGLSGRDVALVLTVARRAATKPGPRHAVFLPPGTEIVFSGSMSWRLDELEQAARDAGLVPMSSVSRRTGVLVSSDPRSESGMATKARALGVRVISEAVFRESLSGSGTHA